MPTFEPGNQGGGTGSADNQGTRTFTQEEVNAIVEGRIAREREKYTDYNTLKDKASKFDAMEEKNKTELQKATEKNAELQQKLDALTKNDEIRKIREKIATETGVPANLLTGETEEDCKQQANGILSFKNNAQTPYPSVKDGGETNHRQKESVEDQFANWFKQALG